MEDKTIFEKLAPEKWNYEAMIITEERIKDILIDKIIKKAKRFVCLITPFWTWGAVNELKLIKIFEEINSKINIIIFGKEKVNKHFHNRAIFNHAFSKLNIRNCWFVKNLHTKLYFNEKYILLTSANITTTSLELAKDKSRFNFEEAVLLKLKPINFEDQAWLSFGNINPFEIPPFVYIKDFKDFRKDRFLLGYGYKEVNKVEVPTIFSFPEMMEEWLLSKDTINTYDWEKIKANKLLHLGEVEDFCPICKQQDYNFSRTFICHKYGIEYSKMVGHCDGPISDCKKGPFFESIANLDQKCPITVFYCPNKKVFFDPGKNRMIDRGLLEEASSGEEYIPYREEEITPILYCQHCGKFIKTKEIYIYFDDYDYKGEIYHCSKCNKDFLEYCPRCYRKYFEINLENSNFHCEFCQGDFYFRTERI